jgi:hypothetical protein
VKNQCANGHRLQRWDLRTFWVGIDDWVLVGGTMCCIVMVAQTDNEWNIAKDRGKALQRLPFVRNFLGTFGSLIFSRHPTPTRNKC